MSPHRLAAQTMLWRALRTLVQSFAPILPHLAEDVFREAPVLFTHGSSSIPSEQSIKEYGSSIFHFGLQQPALYGENAGLVLTEDHARDISESYSMVAGAPRISLTRHSCFASLTRVLQPCSPFERVQTLPLNAHATPSSWGRLQRLH